MTLSFGSLFSGVGGMDLGLERAGFTVKWQVEIDEYAQRVLAKHWPDVPRHSDVRAVGAAELGRVDLIAGGFPCQDISYAGKGAGLEGERSGLWVEFLRVIRELRPAYVLVENVAALLGRGLGVVLGDLAASGFDAEWDCIPACTVGAPHQRDRLFIVAYAQRGRVQRRGGRRGLAGSPRSGEGEGHQRERHGDAAGHRGEALADPDSLPRLSQTHDHDREEPHRDNAARRGPAVAHALRERPQVRLFAGPDARAALRGVPGWPAEPDVGRVVDGFPGRVDRLRGLGNAVVPAVAQYIGGRIAAHAEASWKR